MCGIIGIAEVAPASFSLPIGAVIERCLSRLEYRGYDSVGLAAITDARLVVRKGKGGLSQVSSAKEFARINGNAAIGHTRWATHGEPSDVNAHPHLDCKGDVAVVHNGIISNYSDLKHRLQARGHLFLSETDTEVVPHLIEEGLSRGLAAYPAFKKAVLELEGSCGLAAICAKDPEKVYFFKRDSPLVLGLSPTALFVSSDIPAFLGYTDQVVVLNDDEIGYISTSGTWEIYSLGEDAVVEPKPRLRKVSWSAGTAAKGGYPHYMIKEIHEQPKALTDTFASNVGEGSRIDAAARVLSSSEGVFLAGSGTAFFAALNGKDALLERANIRAHCILSSEYQTSLKGVSSNDAAIIVSQSGETMDSLFALRSFRRAGAKTIALTNVEDSAIARESDYQIYTQAGPELSVAATKTFVTQTECLQMLAAKLGMQNGSIGAVEAESYIGEIRALGSALQTNINITEARAKELCRVLQNEKSMYYLSRGTGVPLAKEGALKIKEVAYIHAEAYEAGESKHGPISMVTPRFPVLFVLADERTEKPLYGNVMEMKSRGAYTIGLRPDTLKDEESPFDYTFSLRSVSPLTNVILFAPTLQLLAYYLAVSKGLNPDRPRNLAKTVTVE